MKEINVGETYIELYNQWEQLIMSKFNWCTFDFFHVGYEWNRWVGQHEFYLALFGFAIRVVCAVDNEKSQEIKDILKNIDRGISVWTDADNLNYLKAKIEDPLRTITVYTKRPKRYGYYKKVRIY
jgi:hypothetical protein